MMATDPIDIAGVVAAAGATTWNAMPAGTRMGHLHLHVGELATARRFYSEGLGFDRIGWDYPGALFMSAGGYHHHLGTNTWAGPRAEAPGKDDAQLLEWTIELPNDRERESAVERLESAGHQAERQEHGVLIADPWGTKVRLDLTP
jgi:catechol 2,3-dioxygenase